MSEATPGGSPRVTVLTTAWNSVRFLDETIRSVLAQDFSHFEYLIVDDASTDGTAALVEEWASRDSRVRLIRNEKNLGVAGAANRGLDVARGEYVARLDSDDLSEPSRLRLQVAALDANHDVSLVSMGYAVIDENGRVLRNVCESQSDPVIRWLLPFGNALTPHSAFMYRASISSQRIRYSERLPFGEDYDLVVQLANAGRVLVLPQVGVRYRVHSSSVSRVRTEAMRASAEEISRDLLSKMLRREVSDDEVRAVASFWHADEVCDPARANQVLQEAYAQFAAQHRDPSLRRETRSAVAHRFTRAAMACLWRRNARGLIAHLRLALRWSAAGTLATVMRLAGKAARELAVLRTTSRWWRA